MKFLIAILLILFMIPVFIMGESPPTVAPALQLEGLDTIAVSFIQDAAFVLYDVPAVACLYNLPAEADQFKMISLSVNAQKIDERSFGITSEFVANKDSSPDMFLFIGEPEIVLRL